MSNLKMTFTRSNFADYVFQPYNADVKRGEYKKIDYSLWKKLRDYLYDESLVGYAIEVSRDWTGFEIWCTHDLKPNPEILFFSLADGFGKYIFDKWDTIYCHSKEMEKEIHSCVSEMSTSVSTMAASTTAASNLLQSSIDSYSKYLTYDYAIGSDLNNTTVEVNTDNLLVDGKSLTQYIEDTINNVHYDDNDEKEKENNKMMKFDFGPVDSSVHMSMYGMAIKNATGTYVAYDKATKQIVDVDILNFEGANKFIYKMPAVLNQVAAGDVIIHARKPMFVQEVRADNRLCVMDIFDGEEKVIVPAKSPFGFDFITKVISLFDMSGTTANASNPFGNMLPFFLMSDSKGGDRDMMLMFAMMNGNTNFAANPMLMYALMNKDGKANDMLPFLLMGGFGANTTVCSGNCSCDKEN